MQSASLIVIIVLYAIILLGVHFIYKDCGSLLGSETPELHEHHASAAAIPGNTNPAEGSNEDIDLLDAQQERQVISELSSSTSSASLPSSAIPLPQPHFVGPPASDPGLMTWSLDDMLETEPNATVVGDNVSEGIKLQDYADPVRIQAGGGRSGFADKLDRALNAPPQRRQTPREQFEILQARAMPYPGHYPAAAVPPPPLRAAVPPPPLRAAVPPAQPQTPDHVASVIGRQGRILNVEPKVVYPSEDGTWGADVADPNPQNHNPQISFSPEQRILAAQRASSWSH